MARSTQPPGLLPLFERFDTDALPPRHRLVLLALTSVQDCAWPDVAKLAIWTGMSQKNLKVVLAELHAARWLSNGPIVRVRPGTPVQSSRINASASGLALEDIANCAHDAPVSTQNAMRRENVVVSPLPRPRRPFATLEALLQQTPGDDLLAVLVRNAEKGNPWCKSVADRLLECGGRITLNERKRLREIRDQPPRRDPGTSSLQPKGNWKPQSRLA